jgi:hypothetical protein
LSARRRRSTGWEEISVSGDAGALAHRAQMQGMERFPNLNVYTPAKM